MSQAEPDATGAVLSPDDLAVDHALAQLSTSIRFLLDITPTDAPEVQADFIAGEVAEPEFSYRELSIDPQVAASQLAAIKLDAVSDATLAQLLRAKAREMELQIQLLAARGSEDFLPLSIELYGAVSPALRDAAELLLAEVPLPSRSDGSIGAAELAELAHAEVAHYRAIDPEARMHVEVRPDVAGVLVEGDTLLISEQARVQVRRARALLEHEIGTHLVTQVNGAAQPIQVLAAGLAGYEETQEGLAVLAEIAVGGFTRSRLRQLAARVLTVARMIGGAEFSDAFEALTEVGMGPKSAFQTTMRVYRGGGLTKDAIYLRGLLDLLAHLAADGTLEHLWLGKMSLRDLPLIVDLADRGVLCAPRLIPHYVDDPAALARLATVAAGENLSGLIEGTL